MAGAEPAGRTRELPLVIAVLADLRGHPVDDPSQGAAPVEVNFDTLEDFMASVAPRLSFRVPNRLTDEGDSPVAFNFRSLRDFLPGHVVASVPMLHHLHENREELAALRIRLSRDAAARGAFDRALAEVRAVRAGRMSASPAAGNLPPQGSRPGLQPAATRETTSVTVGVEASSEGVWSTRTVVTLKADMVESLSRPSEFVAEPMSVERAQSTVDSFVEHMAADPHGDAGNAVERIDRALHHMDALLSAQLDAIFHDQAFRTLEASWRGLAYLLQATSQLSNVRVQVLAASREELALQLGAQEPASALRNAFGLEYGVLGQAPVSLLLVDRAFGADAGDVGLLRKLAAFAAAIRAPCLAGAAPELLGVRAYREAGTGVDLASALESEPALGVLHGAEPMRWMGLVLPRFRMREAFRPGRGRGSKFRYQESAAEGVDDGPWGGGAWCLVAALARAFDRTGWFHEVGEVTGPVASPPAAEASAATLERPSGLTDFPFNESQCATLARFGLTVLCEHVGSSRTRLFGMPTLYRPRGELDDSPLAAPDWLSTLAACRVAHHVRCMLQERCRPVPGAAACEELVNGWLRSYVAPDGLQGLDAGRYPLDRAEATVEAAGPLGWRLRLKVSPGAAPCCAAPVVLWIALPAERITAEPGRDRADTEAWNTLGRDAGAMSGDDADLLLRARVQAGRSARERFMTHLLLAELAIERRQPAVALAVLDELAQQIERFRLDEWEAPAVVVKVWTLLRRALDTSGSDAAAQARSAALLRRICLLDPSAVMEEGTGARDA